MQFDRSSAVKGSRTCIFIVQCSSSLSRIAKAFANIKATTQPNYNTAIDPIFVSLHVNFHAYLIEFGWLLVYDIRLFDVELL